MNPEIVYYPFEGFEFELEIKFRIDNINIVIEDIRATNMVKGDYNKQDFYHHLGVLNYKIAKGELDQQIKRVITSRINRKSEKCMWSKTFVVMIYTLVLLTILIFAL